MNLSVENLNRVFPFGRGDQTRHIGLGRLSYCPSMVLRIHRRKCTLRHSSARGLASSPFSWLARYEPVREFHQEICEVPYVVSALIAIWVIRNLFSQKLLLPPGPPALPIIGHLHLLGKNPVVAFANLSRKYGPLMSLRLGQRQCIVASSPDTAREFLRDQDPNFCSRPYTTNGAILVYNRKGIGFQEYNSNFRLLRKIFTVEFMSSRQLRANQQAREDEVAAMLNSIYKKSKSQEDRIEVKVHLDVMMWNLISFMTLKRRFAGAIDQSQQMQEEADAFRGMIDDSFRLVGVFILGDFIPSLKWLDLQGYEARMKELANRIDTFLSKMVSARRERRKLGPVLEHEMDFVHVMLEQQEGSNGHLISDDSVKAVLQDTFAAGTETLVVTVEWLLTELLRNPAVATKAQEELDHVVGRDRLVQESDLPNLPYLQAVVKETFRMHPPTPLLNPHESFNATKAFGYDIPAKTRLFVNVWAIGRDPAVWEEPLVFNPDRFLQGKIMDVRGLDFELLPFGSGRRMCPAMPLGTTVTQFSAASLIHAFHWSLPDQMDPKNLDMSEAFGLTLPKAVPLQAVATPRLNRGLYLHKGSETATH